MGISMLSFFSNADGWDGDGMGWDKGCKDLEMSTERVWGNKIGIAYQVRSLVLSIEWKNPFFFVDFSSWLI